MKKFLMCLMFLTVCFFPVRTEALDLKIAYDFDNTIVMYDRDSGYCDREFVMVDIYHVRLQSNPEFLDWHQKRIRFNNNIRNRINYAKFTAVFRENPKGKADGSYTHGCHTFNYEYYDKNNKLIFKSKTMLEEFRGGNIAILLQGIFAKYFPMT